MVKSKLSPKKLNPKPPSKEPAKAGPAKKQKKPVAKKPAKKRRKPSAKNFKFGMELEMFVLDEKGYMSNKADQLIKRVKETAKNIDIKQEIGKNMVEINSLPHVDIPNVIETAMADLETVLYCAEQEHLVLYPFGTYPGTFTPKFNRTKRYSAIKKIFGKQRFSLFGRCVGLHCHYTLPWGVFDEKTKEVKELKNLKNKQSMVNIYNLFIAMDPAITTFTQSSPFYQGKRQGKDARVMIWRGGENIDYSPGIFTNHPMLGGLPEYKATGSDLTHIIKNRFEVWSGLMAGINGGADKGVTKRGSTLDMGWNPVKINSTGTMEQRGMDINHPRVIIAIALVIKYIAKLVQENYTEVVPSDEGIANPFKFEKNTIYIPPYTHVFYELQKKAAWEGLENDDIYKYCHGLLKLAKSCMPKNRIPLLEPLDNMLKNRATVSDEIIQQAKRMKIDPEKEMTDGQAAELALALSKNLYKEVVMTRQMLQSVQDK